MATAVNVNATGNAEIDGLLAGVKWSGPITYSFPDSPSDYPAGYGSNEPGQAGFSQAPAAMQAAINYAISLIQGYTNIQISYAGTNTADIQIAQSPAANPTSYAYYPGNYAEGGDIWFGTAYNYSAAQLGNYFFATALHELGHALGLKHSQETGGVANVAVPAAHDDSEYTIMSYRSYVGAPLTGYTAEQWGFSQTYMANDILALQQLYGANYNTHSENTTYSWNPTTGQMSINGVAQLAPGGGIGGAANRVFETIWDGNGVDTYDLSNYSTSVSINLNPGAWTITSTTQLAYLGNGHYAAGNICNAYLFNGDLRSLIDNAIGGSGNDTIIGNVIANRITGGAGRDVMTGGGGADTFVFASGDSSPVSGQHDLITDFTSGDLIDISAMGAFRFLGTSAFDGGTYAINYFYNAATGVTTLQGDINGDKVADFAIDLTGNVALAASNIVGIQSLGTVIESSGSTSLNQVGSNFYFFNSSGTGPSFKFGGSPYTAGSFGAWNPIGVEQVGGGGYYLAWKVAGADQYTVWTTDSNGNYVSALFGTVSGNSSALRSVESTFHQDLNGDGVIGTPTLQAVIESSGSTYLTEVGNNFYLYDGNGVGPSFNFGGGPFAANEFGAWALIGAEKVTGGGYYVAWRYLGTDQYTVWTTDSAGNYVSALFGVVSGSSSALESLEPTFHQDLNGDGVIGVPGGSPITIESSGSTNLTQVGNNFYFYDANATGPSFKFGGSPYTAGSFGAWKPVGVEQVAGGYYIAWEVPGADQYTVWTTDNNGNYISALFGTVSGSSSALRSIETTFHQDLNHDGVISVPTGTSVIESSGSTYLTQVGNNFYLYNSGGTGPSFNFGGAPFTANEFGGWALIGAEQVTGGGYYLAWRYLGTDQYTVWTTDSNGNYSSVLLGVVSGSNSSLESLESTFHQDLNGDGIVGVPGPAGASPQAGGPAGAAPLKEAGIAEQASFVLADVGGSNTVLLESLFHHGSNGGGAADAWATASSRFLFGVSSSEVTFNGSDSDSHLPAGNSSLQSFGPTSCPGLNGAGMGQLGSGASDLLFGAPDAAPQSNSGERSADLALVGPHSNQNFKFAEDGIGATSRNVADTFHDTFGLASTLTNSELAGLATNTQQAVATFLAGVEGMPASGGAVDASVHNDLAQLHSILGNFHLA